VRLVRIAGSGFAKQGSVAQGHPVEFRHWKDVVDEAEAELETAADLDTEEAVVELWLEDPRSFMETGSAEGDPGTVSPMVRRAQTGGLGLQRHGDPRHKTAAASDWDSEFANAKAHAASVLGKLGNGR
jgi:hypothetical protein